MAKKLRDAELTLNNEKRKFCREQVKYIGHVIGNGVIQTDLDKISSIVNYPLKKSINGICRFLGMTGLYRKFIHSYA